MTRLGASHFAPFAWTVLGYNVATSAWGAFVRATGSGAGCGEHWPDCNGQVVPRAPRLETVIEFTHRTTSGLALLLVVALVVGAWRAYPRGHAARVAAATSLGFVISEALVGAALVIFHLVKDDASPMRAVVMGIHLVNTFLLLAALAVTAVVASAPARRGAMSSRGAILWALAAPLLMLVLSGTTGAVAALGDTLFHASSLAQGLHDDAAATAHVFVRLRALHPLIAGLAAVTVLACTAVIRTVQGGAETAVAARLVRIAVVAQVLAGFLNLLLLAPVAMQIVHLVLADALWIAVVVLGARALAGDGAGAREALDGAPAE